MLSDYKDPINIVHRYSSEAKPTNILNDPSLDAWRGAAKFANEEKFAKNTISKKMYEEQGHHYIKEHSCSNLHYFVKTLT